MARRPVDCGEDPEDLGADAAEDPPDGALDDALPEDAEDPERGRADLPALPPPLSALVYPPPLTTRPLVEPELEVPPLIPPVPPVRRSTITIGAPMPYPHPPYPGYGP